MLSLSISCLLIRKYRIIQGFRIFEGANMVHLSGNLRFNYIANAGA